MENLNEKFMKELAKISDPIIFLGLCPILKVNVYSDEKDEDGKFKPKDFSILFKELMSSYDCAGRKRKRELLTILHKANKDKGGKIDGPRTEDTKASIQNEEM